MRLFLLVTLALLAGDAAARAEAPAPPPGETGRYAMTPADGGFLKLDKETGAVSFCTVEGGLAACRLGADERAAFEAEIARLAGENADLRARLAGPKAEPRKPWPGEEELDRALAFTEKFLRRMMKVFREEAPQSERL
jgi:hypothetical protein